MAITIPKKHYAVVQYRQDAGSDTSMLGFISPYTKDSAFAKRKATQEKWAYGYNTAFVINDDDSVAMAENAGNKISAAELFITNAYPRIVENEPIEGFEVAKTVRRGRSWGSGNTLWRVTDPRGYDLEISSENFMRLVDNCIIDKGIIKAKCIWGRDGSTNVLIPEGSDLYAEAMKETIKLSTTVSLKDVALGDTVTIISSTIDAKLHTCQYLGKYYYLIPGSLYDATFANNEHERYSLVKNVLEGYLFKANGKYFRLATIKLSRIDKKIETPLKKEDVVAEVNKFLRKPTNSIDNLGYRDAILISATNLDKSKLNFELEKCDPSFAESFKKSWTSVKWDAWSRNVALIAKDKEGNYGLTTMEHGNHGYQPKMFLLRDNDCSSGSMGLKYEIYRASSYYASSQFNAKALPVNNVDELEFYRIKVTVNQPTKLEGYVNKLL